MACCRRRAESSPRPRPARGSRARPRRRRGRSGRGRDGAGGFGGRRREQPTRRRARRARRIGAGCACPRRPRWDCRFRGVRICALGDLLLDVIVRVAEPIVPGADAVATTRTGAGGQAANVAAWAVALGAEARFVGKRGADSAGELVTAELEGRGVEVRGPVAGGSNGVVVSLVDAAGERTMLSDRGVAPKLEPSELEPSWFADCDWLHLTGYSLLLSPMAQAAEAAASMRGGRLSVDLSSWTAIRDGL